MQLATSSNIQRLKGQGQHRYPLLTFPVKAKATMVMMTQTKAVAARE